MESKTVEITVAFRAGALALGALLAGAGAAQPQEAAAALFGSRCTSCHSFGQGDRVGPDLKGVTTRRPRGWLISWIRSSAGMIKSADPTARALYRKYGGQRMPDFDLPVQDVAALLDYLGSGGPEADARDQVRDAASATAEELRVGRQLFQGQLALASGATACVSCHTLAGQSALGGSLGPDLTDAFTRYGDRGLDLFLQRACLPRGRDVNGPAAVTRAESLALRAFLRASGSGTPAVAGNDTGYTAQR